MIDINYGVDAIRNGAKLAELKCAAPFTVSLNADAEIKLSLSADLSELPKAVSLLTDFLRPHITVDGVRYDLGVYSCAVSAKSLDDAGVETVRVEAYDMTLLAKQKKTEQRLHLSAGTPYTTAINTLLTAAGINRLLVIDSDLTLQTDREDWEIGTDYLTICNELCKEINYSSVYMDLRGVVHIAPPVTASASTVTHRYSANETSIIELAASSEVDVFDAANVFIVTMDNPDYDEPMTATAVNDNPLSALSTVNRGRRIASISSVNNIASQDALAAYAERLKNQSFLSTETVSFATLVNPTHGYQSIVAVDHPLISGIYEETAWSITPGASMTHTARRLLVT